MEIGVIGGGSWGTAMASLWASQGRDVELWMRDGEAARSMNKTHRNSRYLREIELPKSIRASNDLQRVIERCDTLVIAIPLQAYRDFFVANSALFANHNLVLASKGIEMDTHAFPSGIVSDVLGSQWRARTFMLSGPSFAREVAMGKPTTVVIAGENSDRLVDLRERLSTSRFRLYSNPDVVGVELAGALKNVIAIASGIAMGMEFGQNTVAGLITRGLAEIARLGESMGALRDTFSGLAGMGDLILTCTGRESRNLTVGLKLAQGKRLEDILRELGMVAEGVTTTRAAVQLSRELNVELPIAEVVHAILYQGLTPKQGLHALMTRDLKSEV